MNQNYDRYATIALRHNETTREAHAGALEFRFGHIECDPLPRHTVEADFALRAIGEGHALSVRTLGPAERAGPAFVAGFSKRSGRAILAPPAQMRTVSRSDIDIRAVLQVVCTYPAIAGQVVRRLSGLTREREHGRHYNCYRI